MVGGQGFRKKFSKFKDEITLEFSLLGNELIFVNVRAGISIIGIITTIICLTRRVVDQGGQASLQDLTGTDGSQLITDGINTGLSNTLFTFNP